MTDHTHILILKSILDRYFESQSISNDMNSELLISGLLTPDQFFKSETLIHTKSKTERIVSDLINSYLSSSKHIFNIGQICHYCSDWFCHYHKDNLFFNLISHYNYERKLDKMFKLEYESDGFWNNIENNVNQIISRSKNESLQEIINNLHVSYLFESEFCVDQYLLDIKYSTTVILLILKIMVKG